MTKGRRCVAWKECIKNKKVFEKTDDSKNDRSPETMANIAVT
jgi:hypothetical protein